jgi:hypothetical protein
LAGVVACLFLALSAHGQAVPPQNAEAASQLPAGTTICAVLEKTVDARKAKAGDAIVGKTTMAVLWHGKVVIASGARIVGHVTDVAVHSKSQAKSELGITFDRVVLKGGGEVPLQTVVQAIGYGGLPRPGEQQEDTIANPTYSAGAAAAAMSGGAANRRSNPEAPRIETSGTPTPEAPESAAANPALDAGSKGVVGIDGLTLTEGSTAARASVIEAKNKNVKLERGTQLILRIIASVGAS